MAIMAFRHHCLKACEPLNRSDQEPSGQPACQPASQPASQPACLPACQALRAERIKAEADAFGRRLVDFRQEFLGEAPFKYVGMQGGGEERVAECYAMLDAWHVRIADVEAVAAC